MATGTLSDNTSVRILFETGAPQNYMSKYFYMANKSLHTLPNFSASSKGILIGNDQHASVLFVIPIMFNVSGQCFEIYATVTEIHDGIDLVFGMKNMVETEGVLSATNGTFQFINRSISIFPHTDLCVTSKPTVYLKFLAPFCEEISGMAVAKFWDLDGVISTLNT